ncbi:MAG: hypothetical protein P4L46_22950 [Fimbriimonas sp.]|nr:hypothetical protein [Fimbriimonas sp.]
MMRPDEIIETGFAALKEAQPARSPAELVVKACRQTTLATTKKVVAGSVGCLAIVGICAVAFKPQSALAALAESAKLTAAQPIIHMHIVRKDVVHDPTSPPWPPIPVLDVWRFPNRYIRQEGYVTAELRRDGTMLAYDNRFPFGTRSTYDVKHDRFWEFDGTIGLEKSGLHRDPPKVHDAILNGHKYTAYVWQDTDGMHHHTTSNVYVDPDSKLIRFSDSDMDSPNGDTSHSTLDLEFPREEASERAAPHFPKGIRFLTGRKVISDFRRTIGHPDQTKMLAGIRVSLYGVVLYPNVPDGVGVNVIMQGGAGPDVGSGHRAEVVGGPRLTVTRSQWFPAFSDPSHIRPGWHQVIDGRTYIVSQSDDLLATAPRRITVRVPVWRLVRSTIERDGKTVHPRDFVGYVTFTTSKFYCDIGEGDWTLFGPGRS